MLRVRGAIQDVTARAEVAAAQAARRRRRGDPAARESGAQRRGRDGDPRMAVAEALAAGRSLAADASPPRRPRRRGRREVVDARLADLGKALAAAQPSTEGRRRHVAMVARPELGVRRR